MSDEALKEMSLQGLLFRQGLGRDILTRLRRGEFNDAAEQVAGREGPMTVPQAIAKYERQLKEITEEIRARKRQAREDAGIAKPPDQKVQLRPARLGAKAQRR